jgi:hypothetical protein
MLGDINCILSVCLNTHEWILIGTTLFLGFVALFVPYFSELIKRYYFAPSLIIEFEEKSPDCHKTTCKTWNPQTGEVLYDEPFYQFRFRVKNEGKSQAKRCETVVQKLFIANSAGNFEPYKPYTPVNLNWGSGYGEFVDINPFRTFFCDLLSIPYRDQQDRFVKAEKYINPPETTPYEYGIILNVKNIFFSQPNRLPKGKYKVEIIVFSENCTSKKVTFEISWSGNWKDDEQNMFREIVIEQQKE